eukprot:1229354-Pleurochrysis_carterae.AAC.3
MAERAEKRRLEIMQRQQEEEQARQSRLTGAQVPRPTRSAAVPPSAMTCPSHPLFVSSVSCIHVNPRGHARAVAYIVGEQAQRLLRLRRARVFASRLASADRVSADVRIRLCPAGLRRSKMMFGFGDAT